MSKLLKGVVAGFAAFALLVGGSLVAQQKADQQKADKTQQQVDVNDHCFYVGLDWQHYNIKRSSYTSDSNGNPWSGLVGFYTKVYDDLYAQVEGSWGGGRIKGMNGSNSYQSFLHAWYVNALVGWEFDLDDQEEFGLMPYAGIGYGTERFKESLPNNQKTRLRNWWVPFGLYFSWNATPDFTVGIDARGRWYFNRKMWVKDGTTYGGQNVKSKGSFGWLVEIPLQFKVTDEWIFAVVPYYECDKFKPKTNTTAFGNKDYKYSRWGGRLELGYLF